MLDHNARRGAGVLAGLLSAIMLLPVTAMPGLAQDGAQPKAIPEGFVLPGPAPTGGSAEPSGKAPSAGTSPSAGVPGGNDETAGSAAEDVRSPMAFATAPQPGNTNWPCVQRRVPSIMPAQIWAGPPLPEPSDVSLSSEQRQMIDRLVGRRLPLGEAEELVSDYIDTLPQGEREKTATALVSALLARFNSERDEVMNGIERYGAKQKALAGRLREQSSAFSKLQQDSKASNNDIENARQALLWDTRVFDERRRSLTYVCEVPVLIEQRAFGLGRAIAAQL